MGAGAFIEAVDQGGSRLERIRGRAYTSSCVQGASVSAGRTVSTWLHPDTQSVMTFFLPATADTGRVTSAFCRGKGAHHVWISS